MRCLIVENNDQDSELLKRMLKPYGLADTIEDGETALTLIKTADAENDPYEIVFLDIMMPGMDGSELLRRIRKWEQEKHNLKNPIQIIMASSKTDTDTIVQSYDDGCQHFFMKPYDALELNHLMVKMGFSEA